MTGLWSLIPGVIGFFLALLAGAWAQLNRQKAKSAEAAKKEAEAKHKAELELKAREAETYRRGMDVAEERRKRTEVAVDVYRQEAERLRRQAAERVEADGEQALQSGDPGAPGRMLRDVMRADADGDHPDSDARAADPQRGAAPGRFPGAGRPAPRGRR